jgi:hypothetical protein
MHDADDLHIERTRARLAAVERQLVADPANEDLLAQRFRLKNVLASTEWLARGRQLAAMHRVLLADWDRRN